MSRHIGCNLPTVAGGREWAGWRSALVVCGVLGVAAHTVAAQSAAAQTTATKTGGVLAPRWSEAVVGSELERYLRVVSLTDSTRASWTIRAMSPAALNTVGGAAAHPWGALFAPIPTRGIWLVRPTVGVIANSGFPWGINDGPLWAGRGVTGSAMTGVAARWRGISLQLAPQAWWTQNRPFSALPAIDAGGGVPRDFSTHSIDLPQRMGTGPVGRVDPGESWVRVDVAGLTAGVSTASEWWGPGVASGAILSNNAGGFPRAFMGTERPVHIGIGTVHGRVIAGRLARSAYSTDTLQPTPYRLALGMTGSFSPRGLPGLELGFTRFFHRQWPVDGISWRDLSPLWEAFFKRGVAAKDDPTSALGAPDNQLASVFARLQLPRSGSELYWEFAREDHSWDKLDLLSEPDHISVATFGAQHRWGESPTGWWVVHGELTNGWATHLARVRPQGLLYEHGQLQDGHTLRGQLLASPFARGGRGSELGLDQYTARGRLSARWVRLGLATAQEGGVGYGATHTLELSGVRFLPRGDLLWRAGVDTRVGSTPAWDAVNVRAELGWRLGW